MNLIRVHSRALPLNVGDIASALLGCWAADGYILSPSAACAPATVHLIYRQFPFPSITLSYSLQRENCVTARVVTLSYSGGPEIPRSTLLF